MKRRFLSTVFSFALAVCLFGNSVCASELGSAEVPVITAETEETQPEGEAEESAEESQESSEAEESSEESQESSEAEESSEESQESSEAEESSEESHESSEAEESSEESQESSEAEESSEESQESSEAEEPSEESQESSETEESSEESQEEELIDGEDSEVVYSGIADGWIYSVDGNQASIGGYVGTSTQLEIPATIKDSRTGQVYKVTEIANGAFENNTTITRATVPDSVVKIGSKAFANCSNLAEISLGNGVTEMGEYSLSASGIRSIQFPASLRTVGDYILFNCDNLIALEVDCQVSKLPRCFASDCDSLRSVKLGANITDCESYAFSFTPRLMSLYVSENYGKDSFENTAFAFSGMQNEEATLYCTYNTAVDFYSSLYGLDKCKKNYMGPVASAPELKKVENTNSRSVYMSTSTEGGMIFYSTKNDISLKSTWVESGSNIDFTYFKGTVYARTYLCGQWSSTTTITLSERKVPKPTYTVKGVIGGRNVTLTSTQSGAEIYYSTKGANDITTKSSHIKNGGTIFFENFYGSVYAKTYYKGQWSDPTRLILKIPVTQDPVITCNGNQVTIRTSTPNAYIYYTTDGSTPTVNNGKKLSGSTGTFTMDSGIVKAIAVRSCFTNSNVTSKKVMPVVDSNVKVPSFKVQGVIGGRTVTFNTTQPNACIYYSTSSSNITTADCKVDNGGSVTFTDYYGTVYARTYCNGKWSNVSKLILKIPVVNKPTISYDRNGYYKISSTTPDCMIYYTVDGTTPSPTNGRMISASSGRVYIGTGKTIKAIAVRSCFTNSQVATY